jgi:DNA-binding NarL/FixJ family response regulator
MSVLALVSDLMMQSHLSGAARRAGTPVQLTSTTDALLSAAAAGQPTLVILDLSHPGLDPADLLPRLAAVLPGVATVAFGPHVHHERLRAAEAAGCGLVISRGQFHAQTEAILQRSIR